MLYGTLSNSKYIAMFSILPFSHKKGYDYMDVASRATQCTKAGGNMTVRLHC